MRVLVTNDDGIDGPGLHALATALDRAGHDVIVVAPDCNHSGYGAAIGDLGAGPALEIVPARIPGAEHLPAWSLAGPPALCVMAARLGGFGPAPDLVASGVNPGHNTGRSVLHSGTVGAVLTGANLGVSGVAVSVADAPEPRFATAAAVAVAAVGWLESAPPRTVLNVNVPGRDLDDLRGTRWAELAPFGTVRTVLESGGSDHPDRAPGAVLDGVLAPAGAGAPAPREGGRTEPRLLEFALVETGRELPPGSDTALVGAGYVAVTCLDRIAAAEWQPVAAEIDRRLAAAAAVPGRGGPRAAGETA